MERSLARYLRHHRTQGSSPHTLKFHREGVGGLIQWLKDAGKPTDLDDLDADTVREWVEAMRERGLAQATVNRRVRSVKAFTKWLVEEEWLPKDPLRRLKPPKVDDHVPPTLDPTDVDKLLAACRDGRGASPLRDTALVLLLYSTGLRADELLKLQQGDIDWSQGLILVRRGKGGKFRVVPLGGKAEKALDRYLGSPKRPASEGGAVFLTERGEPLTYSGLRQVLRRLEERAGVHANPHKWRHSAAVQYLRNGGKVEVLRAMLGHSTLNMTLHYARIAGVDLSAAHETADPTRSLKTRV